MRHKYIDERWPLLMVLGKHADTGQPCVTDSNDLFMLCLSLMVVIQITVLYVLLTN